MPSNQYVRDGYIFNEYGVVGTYRESEDDKSYAVIARCGHCGNGYFIPIMFGVVAKDIKTAIEVTKIRPRVKRVGTEAILDAFEITFVQKLFIDAVNSHDSYLRGEVGPNDEYLHRRRIARQEPEKFKHRQDWEDPLHVVYRTSDDYIERDVLQRFFAPERQGDKLVYKNRVNHQELLDEFFYQNTIKLGIIKEYTYFISLYYQMYGEGNRLNITYKNGAFEYPVLSGNIRRVEVSDAMIQKLGELGVFNPVKPPEELDNYFPANEVSVPSQTERFQRRLAKTRQLQASRPTQQGE